VKRVRAGPKFELVLILKTASFSESQTCTLAKMNKRSGRSPAFRSQAGAQFDFLSATFNVRGLSLPDPIRVGSAAPSDRLPYLFIARW
jgi:hypothetical protein